MTRKTDGWAISNLAAIAFARRLSDFDESLESRAPRFILYDGNNKRHTTNEIGGVKGYAVGFAGLVDAVHAAGPANRYVEDSIREEKKMFPKLAIRELIANALVHQDFSTDGVSLRIEMYDDRLEVSNPGEPTVATERFIDEDHSRNLPLAKLFSKLGICEDKGSGIDKVIFEAEFNQLPPPEFRSTPTRTSTILFAHRPFAEMNNEERIRACYQHCSLNRVQNKKTNNRSLRGRFGLPDSNAGRTAASAILKAALEADLIKRDDRGSGSNRDASYLPWWA